MFLSSPENKDNASFRLIDPGKFDNLSKGMSSGIGTLTCDEDLISTKENEKFGIINIKLLYLAMKVIDEKKHKGVYIIPKKPLDLNPKIGDIIYISTEDNYRGIPKKDQRRAFPESTSLKIYIKNKYVDMKIYSRTIQFSGINEESSMRTATDLLIEKMLKTKEYIAKLKQEDPNSLFQHREKSNNDDYIKWLNYLRNKLCTKEKKKLIQMIKDNVQLCSDSIKLRNCGQTTCLYYYNICSKMPDFQQINLLELGNLLSSVQSKLHIYYDVTYDKENLYILSAAVKSENNKWKDGSESENDKYTSKLVVSSSTGKVTHRSPTKTCAVEVYEELRSLINKLIESKNNIKHNRNNISPSKHILALIDS